MEQSILIPISELLLIASVIIGFVYRLLDKRISSSEERISEMNHKSDMVTKDLTEALTKSNLEFTSFIATQTEINKQVISELKELKTAVNRRV